MKKIPLTQGQFALVDDKDFEFLNQWKWYARKSYNTFYACRALGVTERGVGKRKFTKMHIVIMGRKEGMILDHKDLDGLNNQRSNLRFVTEFQNATNKGIPKNNTTGRKGVCFENGKYRAAIRVKGKLIHLGMFTDIDLAGSAYDEAAKKYFGMYAKLNSEVAT